MQKKVETKYYKIEENGYGMLVDKVSFYSLNHQGDWVHNQYAISMFVDGMKDYYEINEEKILKVIKVLKKVEI